MDKIASFRMMWVVFLVACVSGITRDDLFSSLPHIETSFANPCVCMPFTQCPESYQQLKASFSLKESRESKHYKRSSEICSGYFDVCCKVECGMHKDQTIKEKILGEADAADFAEFPWMLGILKGLSYKCGASLIHPKVALTAAHCVSSPGKYTVRAGEWNWEHTHEPLPHQDREVQSMIIHPKFDPSTLSNDIALLVLDDPFYLINNDGGKTPSEKERTNHSCGN
ncbi:phenoloxidase-activating factor 2-like isoform X2 [Euwallacea fornicatus]|uniref:phenoloxidase-activating factor 2-like isoform X2 n=1 Tax=Euwallacea fornicatus TaxID=995702 RepID=UPI00338DB890